MIKEKRKIMPIFFCITLFLLVLFAVSVSSESTTLYVGGDKSNNYDSIQDAIDNADSGDIIEISEGSYEENILIDKKLTIRGTDKENTILYGKGIGNIVEITKDNVTIQDLTIKNSTLSDFKINHTFTGIYIKSDLTKVLDCNIMNCTIGIIIKNSTGNIIKNSVISNNNGGIDLFNVKNTKLEYSEISSNKILGGISIRKNEETTVNNCNISFNENNGISLAQSSDNMIYKNIIKNNFNIGLSIVYDVEGICCRNNMIYQNNFIDNQVLNAKDNCGDNFWDKDMIGNYWDDYTGVDEDNNGIGDSSYMILGGTDSYDRYPLMNPMDIKLDLKDSDGISLKISYPPDNSSQSGVINIIGTCSDTEIESVKIRVDDKEWKSATGTDSWNYELDTTQYEEGKHTIYVQATNSTGNISTKSIEINFKNKTSNIEKEERTPGFELVFVFFSLIIIYLVYIAKYGK